jgi:hypothetical protein
MRILFALTVLAFSAGGAAAAPDAGAPASPTPGYVVVQGTHTVEATAVQKLTVFCPARHHALGAGYSAVVQTPPKTAGGPPGQAEGGLDQVRSVPDMAGSGWQVSGVSPDAVRLKLPWALEVRVVCMPVPS